LSKFFFFGGGQKYRGSFVHTYMFSMLAPLLLTLNDTERHLL